MIEGGMRGSRNAKIWDSPERKELFSWWSKKPFSELFEGYHLSNKRKIEDTSFKLS